MIGHDIVLPFSNAGACVGIEQISGNLLKLAFRILPKSGTHYRFIVGMR